MILMIRENVETAQKKRKISCAMHLSVDKQAKKKKVAKNNFNRNNFSIAVIAVNTQYYKNNSHRKVIIVKRIKLLLILLMLMGTIKQAKFYSLIHKSFKFL